MNIEFLRDRISPAHTEQVEDFVADIPIPCFVYEQDGLVSVDIRTQKGNLLVLFESECDPIHYWVPLPKGDPSIEAPTTIEKVLTCLGVCLSCRGDVFSPSCCGGTGCETCGQEGECPDCAGTGKCVNGSELK